MSSHRLLWLYPTGTAPKTRTSPPVCSSPLPGVGETIPQSPEALLVQLDQAREAQDQGSCARLASRLSAYWLSAGDSLQAKQYQQLAISFQLRDEAQQLRTAPGLHSRKPCGEPEDVSSGIDDQEVPTAAPPRPLLDTWELFEEHVAADCRFLRISEAVEKLRLGAGFAQRQGDHFRSRRYRLFCNRLRAAQQRRSLQLERN